MSELENFDSNKVNLDVKERIKTAIDNGLPVTLTDLPLSLNQLSNFADSLAQCVSLELTLLLTTETILVLPDQVVDKITKLLVEREDINNEVPSLDMTALSTCTNLVALYLGNRI